MIIIYLSIVASSISIGYYFKQYFEHKHKVFTELITFCQTLNSEISLYKNDIKYILQKQNSFSHINLFIANYLNNTSYTDSSLKSEDNNLIQSFFNSLGKNDVENEINNINYHKNVFIHKQNESKSYYDSYGNLCIKLSGIIGLLIVILII